MHNTLTDVFTSHTFVGVVDEQRRIVAIQSGVKLLLVDYGLIANEYFYQLGLTDFGNFGMIRLNPPLSLRELLTIAAAAEKDIAQIDNDDLDWNQVIEAVHNQLLTSRPMLLEYFSLEISEDGLLLSLPLLMKGYMPSMAKLPRFLLRLGPHVDWSDEEACFHSFLGELAGWYTPEVVPLPSVRGAAAPPATDGGEGGAQSAVSENPEITRKRATLHHVLEHLLFPALKQRLVATKGMARGVIEVANLKGLYRVFERC